MTLALEMSFECTNCRYTTWQHVLPPLSVGYVSSRYPSWLVLMWSISKCFSVSLSCISLISLIFWSMSELPGAGKVQFIIPYILLLFLQNGVGVRVQDYLIDSRVTHLTLVTSLVPGSHASTNTYLVEQRAKCFLFVLKTLVLSVWSSWSRGKNTGLFPRTHDVNTHWTHTCIWYSMDSMAMATIHKEHGSDWLQQHSAMVTTRWLRPFSLCKGLVWDFMTTLSFC